MPAPYFVTATRGTTGGASLALAVPASAQVGDVVLALWFTGGMNLATPPSGWISIHQHSLTTVKAFYLLIDDAADIKSYSWGMGAVDSGDYVQLMYAVYRGCDPANPVDNGLSTSGSAGVSTNIPFADVTAAKGGGTHVLLAGGLSSFSLTPPSGYAQRYEAAATRLTGVYDKQNISAGAQGEQIATASASLVTYRNASIILNPGVEPSGDTLFFGSNH